MKMIANYYRYGHVFLWRDSMGVFIAATAWRSSLSFLFRRHWLWFDKIGEMCSRTASEGHLGTSWRLSGVCGAALQVTVMLKVLVPLFVLLTSLPGKTVVSRFKGWDFCVLFVFYLIKKMHASHSPMDKKGKKIEEEEKEGNQKQKTKKQKTHSIHHGTVKYRITWKLHLTQHYSSSRR